MANRPPNMSATHTGQVKPAPNPKAGRGRVKPKGGGAKGGGAKGGGKPRAGAPKTYHYGLRAGYTRQQLNTPDALTGNPTLGQAITAANAQAGMQFNPTINSLNTRIGGLPSWFDQYRAQTLAARGFSNAAAQPQIAAAQQFAQNTGQPLGLTGQAGQVDQAAAAGRNALAMLGAQTLQGINNANNNYFNSQYAQIQPQQIQAATQLNTQLGEARQQRAAAAQSALGTIRTQAQNADIANATVNLNAARAQAGEADKRASRRITVRGQNLSAKRAKGQQALTRRGQTLTHKDRVASQQAAQQKAQQKAAQQQQQQQHKFRVKVNSAVDRWKTLSQLPVRIRDPKTNALTGKVRDPTPTEIRAQLQNEGYTSAQINAAMRQMRRQDRRRAIHNAGFRTAPEIGHGR